MSELADKNFIWRRLDSVWRNAAADDTESLVKAFATAAVLAAVEAGNQLDALVDGIVYLSASGTTRVDCLPIVVRASSVTNRSYRTYGDGANYQVGGINYGDAGPTKFEVVGLPGLKKFAYITDSLTAPTSVITPVQATVVNGNLVFNFDPRIAFTPRVTSSGTYYVFWVRDAFIENSFGSDQLGWVLGYAGDGINYFPSLRKLWEAVVGNVTVETFRAGVLAAAGLPTVDRAEQVVQVTTAGTAPVVITPTRAYRGVPGSSAVVTVGSRIQPQQAVTDSVRFYRGDELAGSPVPGLVINTPYGELLFLNQTAAWTYDALRPHPWRFPIYGTPAAVEGYWTALQAAGVSLNSYFTVPGSINPVSELLGSVTAHLLEVVVVKPLGLTDVAAFMERVKSYFPADTRLVVHHDIGAFSDSVDADTISTHALGYGTSTSATTETISISGGNLTYSDYTPLVATW